MENHWIISLLLMLTLNRIIFYDNYIKLENKYHSKVYTKYEYSKNWWLSIDGEHCNNWWLKRNTSNMFYTQFMITISNWKTKNTKGEYCNNVNAIVSIKICIFWVVIFFFCSFGFRSKKDKANMLSYGEAYNKNHSICFWHF